MRSWPRAAQEIADAAAAAIEAARAGERSAFEDAIGALAALDEAQVAVLVGSMVQSLMEQAHPDGLAADDVEDLLLRTLEAARSWYAADPDLMLVVVAGALGMQDPGTEPPGTTRAQIDAHAAVLIAQLLGDAGLPLAPCLEAAMGEIARAETIELP